MTTYTVYGTPDGYNRLDSYQKAKDIATENEAQGRKVSIVQTERGSDWTVYKSPDCTPEY